MKATFPVRDFPWTSYVPTVLFIAMAVLVTVTVYGSLPHRIATTFDFQNNPVGYMNKTIYVTVLIGYMMIMAIIMMIMDSSIGYTKGKKYMKNPDPFCIY